MRVKIKCPYCGLEDYREYDVEIWRPKVECCDCEAGGCEKHFAVTVHFKPEVETFKIEPA